MPAEPVTRVPHEQLRALAESVAEVVQNIRRSQAPLVESQRNLPKATQQLEQVTRGTEDATHRVLDRVEAITAREGEIEALLKELRRALPATYFRNQSKVRAVVEKIREHARANQDDAFTILDALQFQDISTQQIKRAIALLEQLGMRLQSEISKIEGFEPTENGSLRETASHPNAEYSAEENGQRVVDELINELNDTR